MNKIMLIGNLGRDPELTTIGQNNTVVCKFSIGVQRRFSGADGEKITDWFNIQAWKGLGENCGKYLKKGSKVAVIGECQIHKYEDNEGVTKTTIRINADEVQFLSNKDSAQSDASDDSTGASDNTMMPVDDDDLPF